MTPVFLDNVFFHDAIENRMMLILFDIHFKSRNVPVSYYNNLTGETTDTQSDEIRLQIAKEKMGDTTKPIVLSTMTDQKPEFRNLFFNEDRFKHMLTRSTDSLEIYPTYIEEFDDFVRIYFNEEFVDVEYLINTIPQPFFAPLIGENPNRYKYQPLVFASKKTNEDISMTYSYNHCFWKRVFVKNGVRCIEFDQKDWDPAKFIEVFPDMKDAAIQAVPYGRISSIEVHDTERIKHVGRFAQWQHDLTTEHIINKLINLNFH